MNAKKTLSFVLTLCMVLSLFATFVLPASAEEAPFADGDDVKIYCPSEELAISAESDEYNGKYRLAGTDLANAAVFTVDVTDNGIYFICNGKYLTSGATGSNLTLEATASDYSLWALEEADGGWYIKNINAKYYEKNQYVEYYYAFTTYGLDTSKAGIYTFTFDVQEKAEEKTAANLTTDIGIMYSGVTGKYEGVTTLITTPGTYSFTWDRAAMFEQVEGNVYKVVQVVGGSQTAVNLTIADGQFIVSANAGNDWPTLTQGTGWWTGGSDNNGVPYDECPNFCTAHIGAWYATVSALEAGALYEVVGIDLANPVVDAKYVVDFDADPSYSYTKADYATYSYLTPASASSDEEEDAYKERLTYVDGVNVGTIQQRGEQWDDKPASDFWYGVVDYEEYVQITVAVDDRAIIEDDTMLRVWIDADPSDTARTTLIDVKIKNGVAYASRIDGGYDDAFKVANVEYHDDVLFGVEFDKAALGIDGEYGLVVTLSETGRTTMHSIKYDNITGEGVTYAPWTTTEFYEIFGGDDSEVDTTLTIEEAIALGASKEHNTYSDVKYYVTGVITEIYNEEYGNMKITDDAGNIFTIYGTYSADGEVRFDSMETKPVVGDEVTVYGVIGQYNNVPQMKNGWITAIDHEVEGDESDTSGEGTTPDMGDASIAVVVVVMIVAMAGVVVVAYRRRRA